jgi:hypothetical protein
MKSLRESGNNFLEGSLCSSRRPRWSLESSSGYPNESILRPDQVSNLEPRDHDDRIIKNDSSARLIVKKLQKVQKNAPKNAFGGLFPYLPYF